MTEPTEEARAEITSSMMPVTAWLHKSGWEGNAVAEQAVREYATAFKKKFPDG